MSFAMSDAGAQPRMSLSTPPSLYLEINPPLQYDSEAEFKIAVN